MEGKLLRPTFWHASVTIILDLLLALFPRQKNKIEVVCEEKWMQLQVRVQCFCVPLMAEVSVRGLANLIPGQRLWVTHTSGMKLGGKWSHSIHTARQTCCISCSFASHKHTHRRYFVPKKCMLVKCNKNPHIRLAHTQTGVSLTQAEPTKDFWGKSQKRE